MSFINFKPKVEEGDTVIVYIGFDSMFPVVVESGKITQTKYGAMKHDWLVGCKYGGRFQCSKGYVYILHPTPELWTMCLPHRTQILYSTDISVITLELDLKPGSIVCESGTGSASLSHAILRTIAPTGHLHTVEFHEKRSEAARKEFLDHGLGDFVTVYHRDVLAEGFPIEKEADAVFLDIPRPYDAISHAIKALKLGGRLCSFSPCIEQVQRTCTALRDSRCFEEIETIELVHKPYKVRKVNLPIVDIGLSDPDVRRALCDERKILPCTYETGDCLPVGSITAVSDSKGADHAPPRKRKRRSSAEKNGDIKQTTAVVPTNPKDDAGETNSNVYKPDNNREESTKTPPSFTKGAFTFKSCVPPKDIYGHTGYLTFATHCSLPQEAGE